MNTPKKSKSLLPIRPIDGGYLLRYARAGVVRRNLATAPDWAYWPASRSVFSYQAAALSVGIDPESLDLLDEYGTVVEQFNAAGFPNDTTEGAFVKRYNLLEATVINPPAPLSEFADKLAMLPIPPELAAMATAPAATASPKTGAEAMATHLAPNESATDKRSKWEIPGRLEYEAREIGEQWMNEQSKKPGVDAIAKHVEGELKKRNRMGPRRDYWDWQTIKKEALTGITGRKANGKE